MLYNYPEKADLSDINRQTKVRERLEKGKLVWDTDIFIDKNYIISGFKFSRFTINSCR